MEWMSCLFHCAAHLSVLQHLKVFPTALRSTELMANSQHGSGVRDQYGPSSIGSIDGSTMHGVNA